MSRLTRVQAVHFLNEHGWPISQRYFEKLACPSGGQGPKIDRWFGGRALYVPDDLIAWAEARSKPGSDAAAA
jgi:hypothetical protein